MDRPITHPPEIEALLDAIQVYVFAMIRSAATPSDDDYGGTHEWLAEDAARDALGVKLAETFERFSQRNLHAAVAKAIPYQKDLDDAVSAEAARLIALGHRVRFKLIEHQDGSTTIQVIDAGPKAPQRKVWVEGVLSGGAPPCDCDHPHREGAQHKITKVWRQPRHWETCARAVFLAQRAAGRGTLTEE